MCRVVRARVGTLQSVTRSGSPNGPADKNSHITTSFKMMKTFVIYQTTPHIGTEERENEVITKAEINRSNMY